MPWLLIYLAITLTRALAVLLYIIFSYWVGLGLQTLRLLFVAMLNQVVHAPTHLFDKTPVRRIPN